MIPRLSYYGVKGEKMLYRCSAADECTKTGCPHWRKHETYLECGDKLERCRRLCVPVKCIPVEPERVSDHTYAQRAGMLEREKADWIVVVMRPNGKGDLCNLEAGTPSRNMGTEDEARAFLCSALVADYPDNAYRAFRWSDGLKGE